MTRLTTIPYAAVGVGAKAARTIGDRLEDVRRDVADATVHFIDASADEGRGVIAKVPGTARLFGATGADSTPITEVAGVDARTAAMLRRVGVSTVSDMWAQAGDRTGRSDLSGSTGISVDRLAEWAKQADLMRVKSIGPGYAALLEAAGVTSLRQLRRRRAESLRAQLEEANRSAKIVDTVPGASVIAGWIEKAALIGG